MSDTQGAPSQPTTYPQYLRKIGLVVSDASGNGLDLSQMRIRFHVEGMDRTHPKTAIIRVYNLAASTQNTIKAEFTRVVLQAGYINGAYGIIFSGTICRTKTGRESAVDTFIEIQAADGDLAHNFAFVNKTIAAGATLTQQAQPAIDAMKATGDVTQADTTALTAAQQAGTAPTGGIMPRGQVLFGLAKDCLDDVAASTNTSWYIENGVLTFVSNTGYTAGEAVVLNSQTGMVGIPEATDNGIEVSALLNPNIKIGTRMQINNAAVNAANGNAVLGNNAVTSTQVDVVGGNFPTYGDTTQFASVTNDGFYRVLVVTHLGDSRGNDWYTKMICLAIDASAAPGSSVLAYG